MRKAPTEAQKAAAAERREKFRQLAKQVAAMTDEERQAILDRVGAVVTCEGRALSPINSCLLISQLENVSMVGGFQQWIRSGRAVRKGERGLALWVPVAGKSPEAGPSAAAFTTEGPNVLVSGEPGERPNFIMGTVFDISQTDEIAQEQEQAA